MLNHQNTSWCDFHFPEMYVVARTPEPRGPAAPPTRAQNAKSAAVPTHGRGGALGGCRAYIKLPRTRAARSPLLAQVLGCGLGGEAAGVAGPAGLRARGLVHVVGVSVQAARVAAGGIEAGDDLALGVDGVADASPCCYPNRYNELFDAPSWQMAFIVCERGWYAACAFCGRASYGIWPGSYLRGMGAQ